MTTVRPLRRRLSAVQGRDEARRSQELAQQDRGAALSGAAQAKADQTNLEARRTEANGALERSEERRRQAAAAADAEEARLKKATDALATAQAGQQAFLNAGPQREAELNKRLLAAQAAVAEAEKNRPIVQQQLDTVQAQLTSARADQTRLQDVRAERDTTARTLDEQQKRQASLRADIGNLQRSLDERKAGLTKVQAESEILQAEIRNLTPVRDRLHQDIGQREQLDHDLKALNEAIGQKREEPNRSNKR